jgi:hypothetical protein
MLFTIIAEQYFLAQKTPECGMQWVVAMKKLVKPLKLKNVIRELNVQKTDKELQFIKWLSYIILWVHNLN